MAKTTVVLTPYSRKPAIELGNHRWRKQLLPIGDFDYHGRKLEFTKEYLTELIRSFKDRAFDQVPFQLADKDNKHNNDPERFRGDIVEAELTNDGIDVILETDDEGDKLIRRNPKLGVSARIYENYDRSDGKRWTAALQHVLGTLDPHIPGMRGWEPVALSNGTTMRVLDLTGSTYSESEEEHVAFTDEDKQSLLGIFKKIRDGGEDVSDDDLEDLLSGIDPDDDDGDDDGEDELEDGELSDERIEALIAEAEAEAAEEEEDEREPVNASRTGGNVLDLTNNAAFQEQQIELARVTAKMNDSAYTNEKETLRRLGLPTKAIDLARPLLEGEGHVVELSNGDAIDAGAVMRRVLTEIGKTIKVLDLSELVGNSDEPDDEKDQREAEEADRAKFVEQEKKRLGF